MSTVKPTRQLTAAQEARHGIVRALRQLLHTAIARCPAPDERGHSSAKAHIAALTGALAFMRHKRFDQAFPHSTSPTPYAATIAGLIRSLPHDESLGLPPCTIDDALNRELEALVYAWRHEGATLPLLPHYKR